MEWVRVEERSPTENRDYLVYLGADSRSGAYAPMHVAAWFGDVWCSPNPEDSIHSDVTHWMELPEPPCA